MEEIFIEIQDFVKKREWDQFHSPENLTKSIAIEAGELLECFQWSQKFDLEKVCDELADVLIYSFLLTNKLDVDFQTIIKNKIKKNNLKYPTEKSKGLSTKYNNL
ncbi:MAG: nucleotide pyrophosphohydrolase [Bacilli bacterium]|nr:nucleotide pyrophosphohydrolase [Bacilli bacterium]